MNRMRIVACVTGAAMWWAVPALAIAATAGKIDSLSGSVNLSRNGAAVKPLTTGTAVNEGDQISTGPDSWVLLEMADGGSLTLRGKTRMRIDAYVYSETDKSAGKSWLSLLEGAMRSVTGAIGAFNPPSYRLTTPVVTLGIRGTDHETAYYPPGSAEPGVEPGVYDKVNEGETILRTARGDVNLKAGQAGFSDHQGARAPRVLAAIPAFYRRHAEIDRPLAGRMQLIKARREKRIEMFRQHMQHRAPGAAGQRARAQTNHAGTEGAQMRQSGPKGRQEELKARRREELEHRLRGRRKHKQE